MRRWSPHTLHGKLTLAFAALVVLPFAAYSGVNLWFAYEEQRAALAQVQRSSALVAAERIRQFVKEIESQLAWVTVVPLEEETLPARRLDALRVLRQSPAILDLALVDQDGRERVSVSRVSLDRQDLGVDRSMEGAFIDARRHQAYYGPVTFRRETEPYMTVAVAGSRPAFGVAIAEVNLKLIRDVVSRITVGRTGKAWVVDGRGRLVAHPDISLVLSNIDLSEKVRTIVQRADAAAARGRPAPAVQGLQGGQVLASYAEVAPLGWTVVAELPQEEADEPLWRALSRALWIALGSLGLAAALALVLARRIMSPIGRLAAGAARLGAGDLKHRIELHSGDEIEALARQLNAMAGEIEASYAQLEAKVEARTQELARANQAKSRFLAAASHDLRQPLHALSLLVGQLEHEPDGARREQVAGRIAKAVDSINALFDGLLDISKLDAGVVAPEWADVPLAPILQRVHARYADDADAKGLRLLLAPTRAWVRSDAQLLERIVQNLVGNAVRYTATGGVVLGCRWGRETVRIEVWDSGVGIPVDRQQEVFGEFVQLGTHRQLRSEGLGLGLSIVERLCALLQHPISLRSELHSGTRFAVTVPRAEPIESAATARAASPVGQAMQGRRVLVIDDDEAVREGAAGLLQSWGCVVRVAASSGQAMALLEHEAAAPDLVITDFHLAEGEQADAVLAALAAKYGCASEGGTASASGLAFPVILVTGDVTPDTRDRARALGLPVLEKPVRPMALRALASRLLQA